MTSQETVPRLTSTVREHGDAIVAEFAGEIDVYSAREFRETVFALLGSGSRVVVNLQKVRYIDSTGLGSLIAAFKQQQRSGGKLDIVATDPQLRKLFEITGLIKVFVLHPSVDSALSAR